jgi:hypothetical protein
MVCNIVVKGIRWCGGEFAILELFPTKAEKEAHALLPRQSLVHI